MTKEDIDEIIGFSELKDKIFAEAELDTKTKRLIALGSTVAINCDECAEHQITLAREAGFTEEQINEAIAVAALIRFGSGLRHTV
ncbi:carboxymuconolactone decarboxylase family protein [Methanococcoides sp. SA1]|nr:carboxymuconolactone decarboxylase family protein [Methanococcoides sp. SA1]